MSAAGQGAGTAAPAALGTIVVATDFSASAATAVAWAAELARQHGAALVLVHAILPATPPMPEFVTLPPQLYDEIQASARRLLEQEADELRRTGLRVASELVVGPVSSSIVEAATRHHADLLIAGTRGQTGWKRILLGSTVTRLVRESGCPVLTVHPTETGPARAVHRLLVATDFSDEALHAAQTAARLLGGELRHLVLLHVYRVPNEAAHLRAAQLGDAIQATRRAALAEVDALAARFARPGLVVEAVAIEGHPPEIVLEQAKAMHADMIAMGTHGRSAAGALLLGSTAAHVLPWAPCPVLTLRRERR